MEAATLNTLREAELEIEGRLLDASNATFLCRMRPAAASGAAQAAEALIGVYKPTRGERPLDDFPRGTLANRELAAYLLSQASGWNIVPPTVIRDGPFGRGMVQLWVECDPQVDALELVLGADLRLRRIAVFDVLANNADRKGSHLLPQADGHIYGVDHGICFAVAPKLRTVLWAWRGQPLEANETAVVEKLAAELDAELVAHPSELLSPAEVRATVDRTARLAQAGRLPMPDPSRPQIPWPPF